MHERQAIREAVVAQLLGETAAEDRVYKSRLTPVRAGALPAISVYTDDETIDPESANSAPRELLRTVTVAIEAVAKDRENVDDALDDLALEIETAMDADVNLGGTAFDCVLSRIEVGLKAEGDKPHGCIRLEYSVTYHSDLRVSAPPDEFDTADVRFSLSGEQATADQAHDSLPDVHE